MIVCFLISMFINFILFVWNLFLLDENEILKEANNSFGVDEIESIE